MELKVPTLRWPAMAGPSRRCWRTRMVKLERMILDWLMAIASNMKPLQHIPPPLPVFLPCFNRLTDQPLVSGDIKTKIYLGWLYTLLFIDDASTLLIAELVGPVAPALSWPANIIVLFIDVSLVPGQLSLSGGIFTTESASYKPLIFIRRYAYSPGYSPVWSMSSTVRILDSQIDFGSLTDSNQPSGRPSRRTLWVGEESLSASEKRDSGVG